MTRGTLPRQTGATRRSKIPVSFRVASVPIETDTIAGQFASTGKAVSLPDTPPGSQQIEKALATISAIRQIKPRHTKARLNIGRGCTACFHAASAPALATRCNEKIAKGRITHRPARLAALAAFATFANSDLDQLGKVFGTKEGHAPFAATTTLSANGPISNCASTASSSPPARRQAIHQAECGHLARPLHRIAPAPRTPPSTAACAHRVTAAATQFKAGVSSPIERNCFVERRPSPACRNQATRSNDDSRAAAIDPAIPIVFHAQPACSWLVQTQCHQHC